jgi:predicted DNA-binding protein (MmcQ/YjbR family)
MVSAETFRQLALSLPEAIEQPHFEKASFRANKKIFATLDVKNNRACLMLSEVDQSVFSAFDKSIIYPVPNKWGKQGATFIELKTVRKDMLKDALQQAYNKAITKKTKKS